MIAKRPHVDASIEFDMSDMPEWWDVWIDKVNECIHAEESAALWRNGYRIPDQTIALNVTKADFVPREIRGFKHGVPWIAIVDFNDSYDRSEGSVYKYIAVYEVQEDWSRTPGVKNPDIAKQSPAYQSGRFMRRHGGERHLAPENETERKEWLRGWDDENEAQK